MVDTGAEYTALPRALLTRMGIPPVRVDRFESADGRVFEREVGFVILYAGARSGATMVMFADEGDMTLLGAHGLEALNLRIDLVRKELVPAGPAPAAAAA
jgi:predicted aspartyl protease